MKERMFLILVAMLMLFSTAAAAEETGLIGEWRSENADIGIGVPANLDLVFTNTGWNMTGTAADGTNLEISGTWTMSSGILYLRRSGTQGSGLGIMQEDQLLIQDGDYTWVFSRVEESGITAEELQGVWAGSTKVKKQTYDLYLVLDQGSYTMIAALNGRASSVRGSWSLQNQALTLVSSTQTMTLNLENGQIVVTDDGVSISLSRIGD